MGTGFGNAVKKLVLTSSQVEQGFSSFSFNTHILVIFQISLAPAKTANIKADGQMSDDGSLYLV